MYYNFKILNKHEIFYLIQNNVYTTVNVLEFWKTDILSVTNHVMNIPEVLNNKYATNA